MKIHRVEQSGTVPWGPIGQGETGSLDNSEITKLIENYDVYLSEYILIAMYHHGWLCHSFPFILQVNPNKKNTFLTGAYGAPSLCLGYYGIR